jgi:Ca2+-binding RTX toxin-like protein
MGMPAGGGAPTALTPLGPVDANGPNFSPDGTLLTFARCPIVGEGCPEPFEVATMPSGGGAITEVTSNAGNFTDPTDIDPVFAPDGTLIAFNHQEFFVSDSDIFTVGSGGGATAPVTTSAEARNPDWQPLPAKKLGKCDGQRATIQGTDEDDKIVGTPGHDVIKGLKGDDKIKGKGGNDLLCGQRGDDRIFGGRGDDVLIGGKGNDFLKGGPGHDRMFGGTRNAPNDRTKEDFCVGSEQDKSNNCKDEGA